MVKTRLKRPKQCWMVMRLPFVALLLLRGSSGFTGAHGRSPKKVRHSRLLPLSSMSSESECRPEWQTLAPDQFTKEMTSFRGFRVFKDEEYRAAIQKNWLQELESMEVETLQVETRPITYQCGDVPLFGHLIRSSNRSSSPPSALLLFHTGAGPHDIFLLWKAWSLVQKHPDSTVMIADVLSDESGWGWDSDRSRYNRARGTIMHSEDGVDARPELCSRVWEAHRTLIEQIRADCNEHSDNPIPTAALGWCLGGYPILEFARSILRKSDPKYPIKAMVSYHGVFGSEFGSKVNEPKTQESCDNSCRVLVCHGADDPFMEKSDLEKCIAYLSRDYEVEFRVFQGARHGFTNPAQDFNPKPSFAFHESAAAASWTATNELLYEALK